VTQATVKITAAGFNPNPVVVGFVEIVGEPAPQCQITWQNTTTVVQDATSSDGGQTFTTGPIQPGQSSLPNHVFILLPVFAGDSVLLDSVGPDGDGVDSGPIHQAES
jgi:hypothetical protein